jgi:hypothetical protein
MQALNKEFATEAILEAIYMTDQGHRHREDRRVDHERSSKTTGNH